MRNHDVERTRGRQQWDMCNLLESLMMEVWDMSTRAVSIFVGTAFAYYFVFRYVLIEIEKYKQKNAVISEVRIKVADMRAMTKDIQESDAPWDQFVTLSASMDKFGEYVKDQVGHTLPKLADRLRPTVFNIIEMFATSQEFPERKEKNDILPIMDRFLNSSDELMRWINDAECENQRISFPTLSSLGSWLAEGVYHGGRRR
jgi:hypothetical protein